MAHAIALVGAGRMGQCHAHHLASNPDIDFKYIVETNPDAARRMVAAYGATWESYDEVLKDADVKGLVICSDTRQHLPQSMQALSAGKSVFCEKPIGLNLADVRAARPGRNRPPFLLGLNRRFDPHIRNLVRRVHAGEIGKIESIRIVNHDPSSPPASFVSNSGGIFRDFTLHDLDLCRWILDEPIVEVYAAGSCLIDEAYADAGDFDTARTLMKSRSGALCAISNTRRSGCGYDQRLEVFGQRGRLAVDNLHESTLSKAGMSGSGRDRIHPQFMSRYEASYREETAHFADILAGKAHPLVTYDDGISALYLAEACMQSAQTSQPINLYSEQ